MMTKMTKIPECNSVTDLLKIMSRRTKLKQEVKVI